MKLLKSAEKKLNSLRYQAQQNKAKNFQFEAEVENRWNINEHGNVIFDGFLKELGTWYPLPLTDGFYIGWSIENQKAEIVGIASDDHSYDAISQDILEEIYELQYPCGWGN